MGGIDEMGAIMAGAFAATRDSVLAIVRRQGESHGESADEILLGVIARRYGLMTCEEPVEIREVVARSGDLAVADRLAFIEATGRRTELVVVARDGEYLACIVDAPLDVASLPDFVAAAGAPRLMSHVSERGITPALGPLAGASTRAS